MDSKFEKLGVARASPLHRATRHDCPTSNDMCNGCGKHRHWQQVCRASSVKFVSNGDQNLNSNPQSTYVITHVVCQDSLKGIFFDLDLSPPASTPASPKRLRFQADSGFSCNTIRVTDLNKLSLVRVDLSSVCLLDYSKSVIPTSG